MIDVVWSEIFLIGLVAFILLGPRDFLLLLNGIGRVFSKLQHYIADLKMAIDYENHKKKDDQEK